MNALEKIKELIAATEKDVESFYLKGNKSEGSGSGKRIRRSETRPVKGVPRCKA